MRKNLKPVGVILFTIGIISGWTATAFANIPHLQITQQASSCKGTVKDVMGEPIIGASVMVEGTTNGVITDLDGNFSLSNVQKGASIIYRLWNTNHQMGWATFKYYIKRRYGGTR